MVKFLYSGNNNPEAQLIGKAIAAFHENYKHHCQVGLTPPKHQVIPAFTMIGTAPTFYRIVVTEKLLECVREGTYPSEETIVLKHIPRTPDPFEYLPFGIRPLINRRVAFQCFEAFKSFIVCPSPNMLTIMLYTN
jgi:hypothetical protein